MTITDRMYIALGLLLTLLLLPACEATAAFLEPSAPRLAFAADSVLPTKNATTANGTAYKRYYVYPQGATDLNSKAQIMVRTDYAGQPVAALLLCHGSGGNENSLNTYVPMAPLRDALMDDGGYIVVQSKAGGASWGNDRAIADYMAALSYAQRHFNVTSVAAYGGSMGGVACLSVMNAGLDVFAFNGAAATTNLRALWDHPYYDLKPSIRQAYFPTKTKSLANYLTYTTGRDPQLWPDSVFAGVAFRFVASPQDSTVLISHAVDWVAKVGPYSPVAFVDTVGGPHDAPTSEFYEPVATMQFLNTWKP